MAEAALTFPSEISAGRLRAVALVLLTATLLNYANRVTVTQNAIPIQEEFGTGEQGYGRVESFFGLGFAGGAVLFGILADRFPVRWLYALVVAGWSLSGAASGLAGDLETMARWRFVVGLFEAGHWPCALRTTQRLFRPAQRTWANSVLQSGAALGAVLTPLAIVALLIWQPSQWRPIFLWTAALGAPWVVAWWVLVGDDDLRRPVIQTDDSPQGTGERLLCEVPLWRVFVSRRWLLLLATVLCINTLWHYVRVWMPLTLERDHGYPREFVNYMTSAYYLATFAGSLTAGWLVGRLAAGGRVHQARMRIFLLFALLAGLAVPAAFQSRGPLLLGMLLLVGFGSLGLFPIYYSLNQELSARHQGKVSGSLGFSTWFTLFLMHERIGALVDANPSIRPYLFATFGLAPLAAYAMLARFWVPREAAGGAG